MKICVEIHQPGLAKRLCEHFSELDSQHFSDGDWYKFTKSGITKEKAILAVCEAYHADVSEIIERKIVQDADQLDAMDIT